MTRERDLELEISKLKEKINADLEEDTPQALRELYLLEKELAEIEKCFTNCYNCLHCALEMIVELHRELPTCRKDAPIVGEHHHATWPQLNIIQLHLGCGAWEEKE